MQDALQKISDEFQKPLVLSTGAIITGGAKKEASADATNHGTFCLCLARRSMSKRNRNIGQED